MKFICLQCKKEQEIKKNCKGKFCSNECQMLYQFENETLPKFHAGEVVTARTLHRCLTFTRGHRCEHCGNEGLYNGKPLSLQVHHKDGDACNNSPSNLETVCPNCHSQTENYVAKNKGNGKRKRI